MPVRRWLHCKSFGECFHERRRLQQQIFVPCDDRFFLMRCHLMVVYRSLVHYEVRRMNHVAWPPLLASHRERVVSRISKQSDVPAIWQNFLKVTHVLPNVIALEPLAGKTVVECVKRVPEVGETGRRINLNFVQDFVDAGVIGRLTVIRMRSESPPQRPGEQAAVNAVHLASRRSWVTALGDSGCCLAYETSIARDRYPKKAAKKPRQQIRARTLYAKHNIGRLFAQRGPGIKEQLALLENGGRFAHGTTLRHRGHRVVLSSPVSHAY